MIRSPFFALIRKDLKGYFDQPTGYILIVIFVAMLSWAFFKTALLMGEVSLRPLFTVEFAIDRPSLPWLMTLFIPAATMRLLSEEQRDGTLETLLTQPIRGWVVLVTKFLSGLIFVTIAILCTLGIPIAVSTAGNMDWGAVASQYVGCIFLAGSLVSIGLFTSSLTRNQIVAFILGLTLSMVLMIMGLEIVAITMPSNVANLLQLLSPITHFANIGRGVIDLRDILYFVALITTFLSATFLIVRSRTLSHQTSQYRNLQLGVAGLIVLSVLIGWFGSDIKGRIDLTEDKVFSLSPATIQILNDLDDLLTVDIFMSADPPVQVSPVSRDVNDFLDDFEAGSDDNVKVVRHYPEDDEKAERRANTAGVPPVQFNLHSQGELQIKTGYLGIILTYIDKREIIPFVDTIDGFEYRLASLTNKMLSDNQEKKTIGFMGGHGETSPTQGMMTFASVASQQYNLVPVSATPDEPLPLDGVDVLVVSSPKEPLGSPHENSLKEYIQQGGKVFFNLESVLVDIQQLAGLPNRHSLAEFIEREFGIVLEENIVYDLQSNETIGFSAGTRGNVILPYPYWIRAVIEDNKVAGNVDTVVLPWANTLGILDLPDSKYSITPLIRSTSYAAVDDSFRNLKPDSPIFTDPLQTNFFSSDLAVTAEGSNGSRVVIVGDADWLSESATQRFSNNVLLGLNLLDWLAQEDKLASVRSKVVSERNMVFSSDRHRNLVQYSNIGGVPLLLILTGLLRFWVRRTKGFKGNWRRGLQGTRSQVTGQDQESSE